MNGICRCFDKKSRSVKNDAPALFFGRVLSAKCHFPALKQKIFRKIASKNEFIISQTGIIY